MLGALRTVWPRLLSRRWRCAAGAGVLLSQAAAAAAAPLILKIAIDAAVDGVESVRGWAVALAVVASARLVLQLWNRGIWTGLARDVEFELRRDLAARALAQPPRFHGEHPPADLIGRLDGDVGAVGRLLGSSFSAAGEAFFVAVAALTLMAVEDWRLTSLVFLPLPAATFVAAHWGHRIEDLRAAADRRFLNLTTFVEETLGGLALRRVFGRLAERAAGFDLLNREGYRANGRADEAAAKLRANLELLAGLMFLVVLGYGGGRVSAGEITLGSLAMFLAYATMLGRPLFAFGPWTEDLERAARSAGRIAEILRAPVAIADDERVDPSVVSIRGDIRWESVSVARLGSGRPALAEFSYFAPAGQTIAVVGPPGSGKTTLLDLTARLLDPSAGRVLVDDLDVRTIPLRVLRGAIGYAPREPYLFNRSIRENLLAAAPDAAPWQLEEVAEVVGLFDDPAVNWDSAAGFGGAALTEDARRRVSLARALLRDPRILLLDDAMSSLEAGNAVRIIERLRLFMRNRTTLLVTRRPTTARLADRILVIEGGRLVDSGAHDELAAREGYYSALCRRRRLDAELSRDE